MLGPVLSMAVGVIIIRSCWVAMLTSSSLSMVNSSAYEGWCFSVFAV